MSLIKTSRTRILAILVLTVMAIFVVRLFFIQVIQHDYYVKQADSEYIKQFTLHAKRGEIYALDGDTTVRLVMNETVYTVWADPQVVTEKQRVIDVLNKVAGGNTRKDFGKLLDVENSRYQILATKITRTQAEMIKKEKLAGIGFDAVSQRVYPEGQLASQVLGFVNSEGKGLYGFEQYNNELLSGTDGLLKTVTDVRDVPLTIGDKNVLQAAVDGKDMVLTIDRNIQAKAEQVLATAMQKNGAKQASVIVMNPNNGQIMAMANAPTFDPSKLSEIGDNYEVLNNATVGHPYEVGSVAKTLTVAIGLDKNVILPSTTYVNTGSVEVDDRTINNADKSRKLGTITMQDALDWSLNTGMVNIAMRLGDGSKITYGARQTMYDYLYNKFRLGQQTGVELANEATGTVISPDNAEGNAVRYSNMSFGQGMDLTMVQTAAAFCSIINGGTYYKPTVVAGYMNDGNYQKIEVKGANKGVISASASAAAREMIHIAHSATYNPNDRAGYYIGGKTGTSQTIDSRTGQYRSDETIATYLGFGGNDPSQPAYVIMTTISGNANFGGGVDAKPMFNELSNWMIDYLKLSPKG